MKKEKVLIILVIYFYYISQHGLASPNDKRGDADPVFFILGGLNATEDKFPYQVSLRIDNGHFCGGSILNGQWVLTAAHCVVGSITRYTTVVTGTNSLKSGGDTYKVAHSIVHSGFDLSTKRNDIALLKINGYIAFNDKVQPIPLETRHVGAGAELVLSGWGLTSYPGDLSDDLQVLALKAISTEACNAHYSFKRVTVDDTQLCTFTQRGQGFCQGDSGGPLAHNGKLAGIASWGYRCAFGLPDVFTRVSSFLDWINNNMQ